MSLQSRLSMSTPQFVSFVRWFLLIIVAVPTAAALILGELFGFYQRFWWWDNLLHLTFGVVIGIYGILLVYILNRHRPVRVSPMFVAIFVFSFAVMVGVIWEFFEFFVDMIFGTNMQRWQITEAGPLIGLANQGNAIRDTISDMLLNTIGALIPAVFSYYLAANKLQSTFRLMQQVFPATRD